MSGLTTSSVGFRPANQLGNGFEVANGAPRGDVAPAAVIADLARGASPAHRFRRSRANSVKARGRGAPGRRSCLDARAATVVQTWTA
jgi:hypothetical protein